MRGCSYGVNLCHGQHLAGNHFAMRLSASENLTLTFSLRKC